MLPAFDQWLRIVKYRDFWDFPHFLLVADPQSNHWIMDAQFDEERDDYAVDFLITNAGSDPAAAALLFERIAAIGMTADAVPLPVSSVRFDDTRRQCVRLLSSAATS